MAKKQNKGFGLGLNDKTVMYLLYGMVLLVIIQNIKAFIGFALVLALIAAAFYWLNRYAKELEKNKLLQLGISEIDHMKDTDLKRYLGALFESLGYKVQFTSAVGNYGADLLIRKGNKSIAVQAKRFDGTAGIHSIQKISEAKKFYKTSEAWVVTNNTFTKNECSCAEKLNVQLIDRSQLIHFISNSKIIAQSKETRPV